jgi:hypothetical protein
MPFSQLRHTKTTNIKKEYQDFRFSEKSVITQFIKYESMFSRCIELGVTILAIEKKEFLVKSLSTELQQYLINIRFMIGEIVTVENLTYTQIKEMMIQRWESMETLRLNEKGNKIKRKAVEEKKKSEMKTALNVFKRDGRERESRDRGERGERERGVGAA